MTTKASVKEMMMEKEGAKNPKIPRGREKAKKTVPRFNFLQRVEIPKREVLFPTKERREENLREFKKFESEAPETMHYLVNDMRAICDMEPKEARLYQEHLGNIQGDIKQMLDYPEPAKTVAVLAYVDALVKTCPELVQEVKNTVQDLENEKCEFIVRVRGLQKPKAGMFEIYQRIFMVSPNFSHNDQSHQAKEVVNSLLQLVQRTDIAEGKLHRQRFNEVKAVVGEESLSFSDLKKGEDGRKLLELPDQEGIVAIEVSDGKVRVLDGVGECEGEDEFEEEVQQLVEAGTSIPVNLLFKEKLDQYLDQGPWSLFKILRKGVFNEIDSKRREERKEKFQEQIQGEREEWSSKATLNAGEFYFDEKAGSFLYDYGTGPFTKRFRNGEVELVVWSVICLVERDEKSRIRVSGCPERLNGFFAEFKEWQLPGDKFDDLRLLGFFLRRGFAKALDEQTPEEREAREKAGQLTQARKEAKKKAKEVKEAKELAKQLAAGSGEEKDVEGAKVRTISEGRKEVDKNPKRKSKATGQKARRKKAVTK